MESERITPPFFLMNPLNPTYLNKKYNPKRLREGTKTKIKVDDKQLKNEVAEKMINSFYFTHKVIKAEFNTNLHSHHSNHKKF